MKLGTKDNRGVIRSLHCLWSLDNKLGGAVHAALNVCKYLAEANQAVEVVATYDETDDLEYLQQSYPKIRYRTFERSFPRRFANSEKLIDWFQSNVCRYQIVEFHSIFVFSTMLAARVCRQQQIPYLVRPHGSLDPFDLKKHASLKKMIGPLYVAPLLRRSAGVVCTSSLESERLVTYGAEPARNVIPLPVPVAEMEGDGTAFRRYYNVPVDAQVVLFLSRIDYKKGLDYLIPALGRLKNEFPRLWFVLAGAGTANYVKKVRQWLVQHDIKARTLEVGFLSGQAKWDALGAADILALPSRNENFGIVNIEAMYARLPLLISTEVYISEEIEKAGAGIVCSPNVDSVTERLRSALNGTVNLKEMGNRGRSLVRVRYKPEAATRTLVNLYESIVN